MSKLPLLSNLPLRVRGIKGGYFHSFNNSPFPSYLKRGNTGNVCSNPNVEMPELLRFVTGVLNLVWHCCSVIVYGLGLRICPSGQAERCLATTGPAYSFSQLSLSIPGCLRIRESNSLPTSLRCGLGSRKRIVPLSINWCFPPE